MPNIIPGYKTLKGAVKGVKELHTGMLRVDDNINNQVESTGELAGILTCYLIYGSNALAVMAGTGNPYFLIPAVTSFLHLMTTEINQQRSRVEQILLQNEMRTMEKAYNRHERLPETI